MKLSISNIAWDIKERKKIYKFLISKNIEGLEIAPKLFLHNHKNFFQKTLQVSDRLSHQDLILYLVDLDIKLMKY